MFFLIFYIVKKNGWLIEKCNIYLSPIIFLQRKEMTDIVMNGTDTA